MAISATAGGVIASFTQGADYQQAQAVRNAERAEQAARALQNEASRARSAADVAQENARSLEVKSSQAQAGARDARQGVAAGKSLGELRFELDDIQQQARNLQVTTPAVSTATSTAAAPAAVVNTQGQTTGTVINVTA